MNNIILLIIFFITMLPGIAGAFLPIPGLLYMFIVAGIFGFIGHFEILSPLEMGILAVITVLSILNDYFSGILGARYGGASSRSMLFGIIGTIIGVILLPPFGGLLGVFIGIFIAEMIWKKDRVKAIKAASGGLIGSIVGMIVTLILSILFLFLFVIFGLK